MITQLNDLPHYIYGTTRLGDDSIDFGQRVEFAKYALTKTNWFHTSHTYSDAIRVIKEAADQSGIRPKTIVKIGWESVKQIREIVHENLTGLGADRIEIGQLCLGGEVAEQFQTGSCNDELNKLRQEGLVGSFVLESWPWNSGVPLQAIKTGRPFDLIDGFIFYFNPLQRFVSSELWKTIQGDEIPFVAMRTTCGGSIQNLIESENAPAYLKKRAIEVLPLFQKSGCENWTEFCARFELGTKGVAATLGATANHANLDLLVLETADPKPLEADIVKELLALQEKWFIEHDSQAEPWSM